MLKARNPLRTASDDTYPVLREQEITVLPDDDWSEALPHDIARPTSWPFLMALGVTLLAWGLLASWLFVFVGGVLTVLSGGGWVYEMQRSSSSS